MQRTNFKRQDPPIFLRSVMNCELLWTQWSPY